MLLKYLTKYDTITFWCNDVDKKDRTIAEVFNDFLATSVIEQPIKLIKKGMLSAYFISGDQGADFWFGCNTMYEKKCYSYLNVYRI